MKGGAPEVVVLPDADAVALRASELTDAAITAALEATGRADIAVPGGRIAARLFDDLTQRRADWTGVHLWVGDERCVPYDDPDSNVKLIREHLPAPGAVVHVPPEEGSPERRAMAYGFQLKERALDLILLGMGEDAHTASLFPDDPVLGSEARVVFTESAPKPPPERTSLGLVALSEAKARIFLVTGEAKREALAHALGEPNPTYPSSLLPAEGTTVLADPAAAGDG